MPDEWSNKDFAEAWDNGGADEHPARSMHLRILLSIIVREYQPERFILDLGYGSGQVEEMIYSRVPEAQIVGVDNSDVMIELSKKRLRDCFAKFTVVHHGLEQIDSLKIPEGSYQFVLAVQALHHLPHSNQKQVFQFAHDKLNPGGCFLFIDRVALDVQTFALAYRAIYEKMFSKDLVAYIKDIEQKEDFPATVEEHLLSLAEVGFQATCLSKEFDRAFIFGIKPN